MPYLSSAQRKLFHAKLARGEISARTVKKWDRLSRGKKLPEYVGSSVHNAKGERKMARKKKRKSSKKSAGAWSPAQLAKYKKAKRKLIQLVSKGGSVSFYKK